ncbi:hypothetical protein FACS1894204_13630 [Synergistales bacterium]|nr:hypothetical protein FACS1894204_13630 [Synergistales bacterium]
MNHLFATWRMDYIQIEKPAGCIFCDFPKENNDDKRYILALIKLGGMGDLGCSGCRALSSH